ncbi:MAG: DMT family transporter [Cellvibrionaceae bacterium]
MFKRYPIIVPLLFVFIYGSGFVGSKLGLSEAEPFTFLAIRFFIAAIFLGLIACWSNDSWRIEHLIWLIVSSLLLQGALSAGTFYAIFLDMKPAVCALIIALQPLLVAVLSGYYLGESVSVQRWFGLVLGISGVAIVVADGLTTQGISLLSLSWALFALVGLTMGQLIQKKYCTSVGLFSGGFIQTISLALVMLVLAAAFETMEVNFSIQFVISMFWMAIGVSIGALSLLYLMLRQNTANQVASMFYGMPVTAALVAWPLFGQAPTSIDWLGFLIVAISVVIANSEGSISSRFKFTG